VIKPEVVNIPVPIMLAKTTMVAENRPSSLFRVWSANGYFLCRKSRLHPSNRGKVFAFLSGMR